MLGSLLTGFAALCEQQNFFNFPTWYKYLILAEKMEINSATGRCEIISYGPDKFVVQDIGLIALALVDIAFRIAALAAVAYIIYGGVQFVVAQGESDKTKKARQTVINAMIGLVIALISIGLVAFIGGRIGAGAN